LELSTAFLGQGDPGKGADNVGKKISRIRNGIFNQGSGSL
jgi:hypothetical protein